MPNTVTKVEDKISVLLRVWEEMIANSHRKSRDGYFGVIKSWSAKDGVSYVADHDGYIGGLLDAPHRKTYAEAEADLHNCLMKLIQDMYDWAKSVVESGDRDELDWHGYEAEHVIAVYEGNVHVLREVANA